MAKGDINYIRERYKVDARIGKSVRFDGHSYRIAAAHGSALVLRDEIYVHPTDPGMDYNPPLERRPKVVCLCGSTRFSEAYQKANFDETLAGWIVLTIGCDMRSDADLFAGKSDQALEEIKTNLDRLHKCKIDLADEILVLNVGGYVGSSTKSEIEYARARGKVIRWLKEPATPF